MDQVNVTLTDEAKADLRALPSQRLRVVALQWMQRLKKSPDLGAPLDWREGQDLREAFKLYFAENDTPLEQNLIAKKRSEEGAPYRIVYRLLPSARKPATAQVIAVGPKYGPEGGVYARAAKRYEILIDLEP